MGRVIEDTIKYDYNNIIFESEELKKEYEADLEKLDKEITRDGAFLSIGVFSTVVSTAMCTTLLNSAISGDFDINAIQTVSTCVVTLTSIATSINAGTLMVENISKKSHAEKMIDILDKGLLDSKIIRNSTQGSTRKKVLTKKPQLNNNK